MARRGREAVQRALAWFAIVVGSGCLGPTPQAADDESNPDSTSTNGGSTSATPSAGGGTTSDGGNGAQGGNGNGGTGEGGNGVGGSPPTGPQLLELKQSIPNFINQRGRLSFLSDGSHGYITTWEASIAVMERDPLDGTLQQIQQTNWPYNGQAVLVSADDTHLLVTSANGNTYTAASISAGATLPGTWPAATGGGFCMDAVHVDDTNTYFGCSDSIVRAQGPIWNVPGGIGGLTSAYSLEHFGDYLYFVEQSKISRAPILADGSLGAVESKASTARPYSMARCEASGLLYVGHIEPGVGVEVIDTSTCATMAQCPPVAVLGPDVAPALGVSGALMLSNDCNTLWVGGMGLNQQAQPVGPSTIHTIDVSDITAPVVMQEFTQGQTYDGVTLADTSVNTMPLHATRVGKHLYFPTEWGDSIAVFEIAD